MVECSPRQGIQPGRHRRDRRVPRLAESLQRHRFSAVRLRRYGYPASPTGLGGVDTETQNIDHATAEIRREVNDGCIQ